MKILDFKVYFRYTREGNITTECFIEKDRELVSYGKSICSVKDRFEKEKGRVVALKRALSGFDKPTRTIFWNQYLNRGRDL